MTAKAEVKVMSDGSLFLDGQAASLAQVDECFAGLAGRGGVVWYYREAAGSEPPPVGPEVIRLVIKYRLPISLATRPDFSDVVDGQGTIHPRR